MVYTQNMYEAQRAWAKRHPDKVKENGRIWRAKNKEKIALTSKLRWEVNKNDPEYHRKRRIYDKKYKDIKRKEDPVFRIKEQERLKFVSEKYGQKKKFIKLRFMILKRDNYTCQYCGSKPPTVTLHIDHIIPVSKGGLTIEENLITACMNCNLGKGDLY